MPVFFEEQEVTLSAANTWEDVDLSSFVPEDAEVVFLIGRNSTGNTRRFQVRCNGSTQSFASGDWGLNDGGMVWQAIKVDVNKTIEVYRNSGLVTLYIFGYLKKSEISATTNMPFVAPTTLSTWEEIDLSSHIPSGTGKVYGALIHPVNNSGQASTTIWGVRNTDSTNEILQSQTGSYGGLCVVKFPPDGNTAEFYLATLEMKFYIVGFLKQDIVEFHDEAIDVTPTATNLTFEDTSTLPSNAIAGIYETISTGRYTYNMKGKDATIVHPTGYVYRHIAQGVVQAGTDKIVQMARGNVSVQMYELGYWKPASGNALFFGTNF